MAGIRAGRALCALVLLLALTAPAAYGGSPAAQIAALNGQREAHGIPAGIVENPEWSQGCAQHNAYIAANGGVLTHEEVPGKPGYTVEGAAVANRSVLTPMPESFGATNAFEFAPLHLMQVLAPALSRMGVSGGCATTSLGYDRKGAPALFSYPGNNASLPYLAEVANEMPFTPGDFVGLPRGTTTGPHLYVMSLGTGPGRITGASLTGSAGPVDIRTVDNMTGGLSGYLPPGGIIIPVGPLPVGTYRIAATFQPAAGAALSLASSFTAGAPAPAPAAATVTGSSAVSAAAPKAPATLRFGAPRRGRRTMAFPLAAGGALVGRRATITMRRIVRRCSSGVCRDKQRGRTLRTVIGRLASTQTVTAPRPGRGVTMRMRVQTQAFERAGVHYAASSATSRCTR